MEFQRSKGLGLILLVLSKNMTFNIVKEKITLDLFKALSNMYEKQERKQNHKSEDDDGFVNST